MMDSIPIATVGSLVRDIIYIKNAGDSKVYLAGSRGGGSSWNALANAAVKGARTLALCVGGYDEASKLCIDDLQSAGVTIEKERLLRGKKTRTIHEMLIYNGVRQIEPKHECSSICPICFSETYNKGTAQLSQKLMMYFGPFLKNYAHEGIIVHIDSLNEYRLNAIKSLGIPNMLISIDLGRLTNLRRLIKEDTSKVLGNIDIIFVNSSVMPKLKILSGVSSEEDLLKRIDAKILVSLNGTKGIKAWIKSSEDIISFEQHALETEYIIDTVGAGDAFIGSFLSTIAKRPIRDLPAWLEGKKDIEETIYSSQQWAAEKCKFLGGRGHIKGPYKESIRWDFGEEIFEALQPIEELKTQNEGLSRCRICGFDIKKRIELDESDQNSNRYDACTYGAKKIYKRNLDNSQVRLEVLIFPRNVLQLRNKIRYIWPHRHETPWGQIFDLSGTGYVIGSGGSYVVASYIAQLISYRKRAIAIPSRPFDFIRMGSSAAFSIFISSSGSTPDIMGAIRHAKNIGIPKLLLITGNKRSVSSEILGENNDVLLCTGANEERGFLSVIGVIAPCFFSWAAQSEKIWYDDDGYKYFNDLYLAAENRVNRIFSKYKRDNSRFKILGRRSIILGGGYAWPAMLDLESKMVESDLGRPIISEIKDYSHGRFVSSMNKDVLAIVFGMPDDVEYRRFLIEKLNRSNDIIEINSDELGPTGSLDLLLQVEHLMRSFAERETKEISKPKIPPNGLELYRYEEKPFRL